MPIRRAIEQRFNGPGLIAGNAKSKDFAAGIRDECGQHVTIAVRYLRGLQRETYDVQFVAA